ncbi:MAG TPA: dTMP kinase [Rubricoccaceae bacterium]|nr:dTMP kinase [Rubricoccaceae bacterium]
MFISFEGIDGSGKSTQARLLEAHLRRTDRAVLLVREPGGTALAERVRALLLGHEVPVGPFAELLLFSAARAQLVEEVLRPTLAAGTVVLADRFFDSTTAYQGGGRGLADAGWLADFHRRVTGGLVPERTFLFDVPPEVAARRRAGRDDGPDRMEAGGEAFFTRVRDAYLALAAREPARVRVLDGTLPPDWLHEQVVRDVERRLAEKGRKGEREMG